MSDDGPMMKIFKGMLGDLQKSIFDDYEDREFVAELERKVRSEIKLKKLPADGVGRTAALGAQRQIIDQHMLMILPFCKAIAKHQDKNSLNFDSGAAKKLKKSLQKQLKEDSKNPDNLSALLSCFVLLGKAKEVQKLAKALTSSYANYGMGWYMYGAFQWLSGNPEVAAIALKKAANLLPEEKLITRSLIMVRMNR